MTNKRAASPHYYKPEWSEPGLTGWSILSKSPVGGQFLRLVLPSGPAATSGCSIIVVAHLQRSFLPLIDLCPATGHRPFSGRRDGPGSNQHLYAGAISRRYRCDGVAWRCGGELLAPGYQQNAGVSGRRDVDAGRRAGGGGGGAGGGEGIKERERYRPRVTEGRRVPCQNVQVAFKGPVHGEPFTHCLRTSSCSEQLGVSEVQLSTGGEPRAAELLAKYGLRGRGAPHSGPVPLTGRSRLGCKSRPYCAQGGRPRAAHQPLASTLHPDYLFAIRSTSGSF